MIAASLHDDAARSSGIDDYLGLSSSKIAVAVAAAAPITTVGGAANDESPVMASDDRPTIQVKPGEVQRIVKEAETYLAATRRYFQRGGAIVSVYSEQTTRTCRVQPLDRSGLLHALDGVARWERFDGRKKEWVQIDPPEKHIGVLLAAPAYASLPVLHGLPRQPYLRDDGSLCAVAGYDDHTHMFGVFEEGDFAIPESPTRHEAEAALALLEDVISEFAFAKEFDRAAAIGAMVTAALRTSLKQAPMFHVRAPQISSGKSYLCELITAFATAQRGSPVGFPGGNDECNKLLMAELARAPAVIEFDNLTGDLVPHKSLCTVLTSEQMTGRLLGASKMFTVSTRALFLSSGNNVGPVADMTRRVVTIHLDPHCEMPATRAFKRPNLLRDILAQRGRYVSAALTLVRAWIVAGRPMTVCKPIGSFTDWSAYVRQPLLWLGRPDPAQAVFDGMAEDPDRETLGRLMLAWHGRFASAPTMVRDLVSGANGLDPAAEELREVLSEIAGEGASINRKRLGRWVKRHAGQLVDGLKIKRSNVKKNAETWEVESVSAVSSVSNGPGAQSVREEEETVETGADADGVRQGSLIQ